MGVQFFCVSGTPLFSGVALRRWGVDSYVPISCGSVQVVFKGYEQVLPIVAWLIISLEITETGFVLLCFV